MRNTAGKSGALSEARLNAAVRLTVEKLKPDVIVLFGSAARSTMREGSDIDLLALRNARKGEHPEERYRWWCPDTGDDVDVVRVDRETLRRERRRALAVEAAAMAEGRIVYRRPGSAWEENEREMVRYSRFYPAECMKLVRYANNELKFAEDEENEPVIRCKNLQSSLEYALKAIIAAQGMRVVHTRSLVAMWNQAESRGETIGAAGRESLLELLSRYGGSWQYKTPGAEDPEETWRETKSMVRNAVDHATRRVPVLARETQTIIDRERRRIVRGAARPAGGREGDKTKDIP